MLTTLGNDDVGPAVGWRLLDGNVSRCRRAHCRDCLVSMETGCLSGDFAHCNRGRVLAQVFVGLVKVGLEHVQGGLLARAQVPPLATGMLKNKDSWRSHHSRRAGRWLR